MLCDDIGDNFMFNSHHNLWSCLVVASKTGARNWLTVMPLSKDGTLSKGGPVIVTEVYSKSYGSSESNVSNASPSCLVYKASL